MVFKFNAAQLNQLDQRIDGNLTVGTEADLYAVFGESGQTISVSAYLGRTGSSRDNPIGINRSGRVRLLNADGIVLIEPVNVERAETLGSQSSVRTVHHVSTQIDSFELPGSGTYYIEVSGGIGDYWIGISDPVETFLSLPLDVLTSSIFSIQGDKQEYEFTVTVGQSLAWTYQGERSLQNWAIYDPEGKKVIGASEGLTTIETFSFTATISGVHLLMFEDAKFTAITDPAHIGPFNYSLIPTHPGDFNGDFSVDDLDLALWGVGFGTASGAIQSDGDADFDGDVDGNDFLAWQRNYSVVFTVPATADYDSDSDIDGADFLAWQRGFSNTYDSSHLAAWEESFGQTNASSSTSRIAINTPEQDLLLLHVGPTASVQQLIDTALVLELQGLGIKEEQTLLLYDNIVVEAVLAAINDAETSASVPPEAISTLEDAPADSGDTEEVDLPWMTNELLELVFG